MMSFMLKKKKFKFHVDFLLVDLNDVPYVNAVLFAKIRLLDGGNFCELSPRVDVINHHVCWVKQFEFSCRIASHHQTGVLEPRICRVSIRKELKGGKSFQKLGFCDVNLSEYAGSGVDGITRTYLLEGYDSGHQRQDNSLLKVNIKMTLQSADPCFKVPQYAQQQQSTSGQQDRLNPVDRRVPPDDTISQHSLSSGFESLPRIPRNPKPSKQADIKESPEQDAADQDEFAPGHSRNSSQTSQQSQAGSAGYGSGNMTHSRQSSAESGNVIGHARRPSADMAVTSSASGCGATAVASLNLKPPQHVKLRVPSTDCPNSSSQSRIDSTRVDAGELIDELIKDHDLQNINETDQRPLEKQGSGLQLYISKEDGSAAVVGSQDGRFRGGGRLFEQVIIHD